MRSAIQAKCLCLAILSGIVGTGSGAEVDAASNNRVGVSEQDTAIHTYEPGSLKLEPQRGDTIPDYDLEGNRTDRVAGSATRTYDNDRKQCDKIGRTLDEGEAGARRVSRTMTRAANQNRLLSVTEGTNQWRYDYDYRTRRVMREENGQPERISFSGGTRVQEYSAASSVHTPTVEYIRGSDMGGGIGGILYSVRGGTASFSHYNARGDVVAKSGSTGALTWQARYEGFGSRTSELGTTPDKQRANTREEEPWGGLYENMRWRDLETGQYFTRDPAGFVDGPNLYAYVNQNPWTAFDPLGLEGVTAIKPEVTRPVHHRPPSGSSAVRAAAGRAAVSNPAAAAATGFVATGVAGSMAGTAAVSQHFHARDLRQQASQPQPAAYGNSTANSPQPAPQLVNAPPQAPPQPDGETANSISLEFSSQHVGITVTKGDYNQFSHLQTDERKEQAFVTTDRETFKGETLTLNNVSDSHINAALVKQSGQLANTLINGSAGPYNEGSSDCVTHTRGVANAGAPPANRISRPERSQSSSTKEYVSEYKKNARAAGYK